MPNNKDIPMPSAQGPDPANRWAELGTPFELASLFWSGPQLLSAPRGDNRQIVLLPGYMGSPISMAPLASYLRFLGYRVRDWGLGTNRGGVDSLAERLGTDLVQKAVAKPVTLIGWSLGGVVAREVARLYPEQVAEVITFGSPIIGGPKYTSMGQRFANRENLNLDAFEKEVHRRNSIGITQPLTVMYSKSDGIVGWQAAVDVYNEQARNVEVNGSHLGLGTNPGVWLEIAETLGRPAAAK